MSESQQVPAEAIESIVGAERHQSLHIGRAISADRRVFILHSQECKDRNADLTLCKFDRALQAYGITESEWPMDTPVPLRIVGPRLLPQIPERAPAGAALDAPGTPTDLSFPGGWKAEPPRLDGRR